MSFKTAEKTIAGRRTYACAGAQAWAHAKLCAVHLQGFLTY